MRFFHGDGPACQFEAGQQKGGTYPCWVCPINIERSSDVTYTFNLNIQSVKQRMEKVLESVASQSKIHHRATKLYNNLSKTEIMQELHERGVKFIHNDNKNNLELKLKVEMHGIQRLPALYFEEHDFNDDLMINKYEILPCEPLHDVKGHISNLYEELIHHVNKQEKEILQNLILLSFEGKDCKRGVDYRKSIVKLVIALDGKIDKQVYNIFSTMCNIQALLYYDESKRTVENILRLNNQIFLHIIFLKEVVGMKPVSLTTKKMYGKYYHALIAHSHLMLRLISGKSTNTEEEERTFNTLKSITASSSNHHPDHVILNSIIRLQCKQDFEDGYHKKEQNIISKLSQSLKIQNSEIPFWIIEQYPWEWQSHLERIPDYLLESCWWIETNEAIVFKDTENNQKSLLTPHHFRSSSMLSEQNYLKDCWEECLLQKNCVPALKLKLEIRDEVTIIINESLSYNHNEAAKTSNISINLSTTEIEDEVSQVITSDPLNSTAVNLDLSFQDNEVAKPDEIMVPICSSKVRNIIDVSVITEDVDVSVKSKSKIKSKYTNDKIVHMKPVLDENIKHTEQFGKTASLILKVLPKECDLVKRYDTLRKRFKASRDHMTQKELKKIDAMIQVKIMIIYETLKNELKEFEKKEWHKNSNFGLIPSEKDDKIQYDNVLTKIKIVSILRLEMKF